MLYKYRGIFIGFDNHSWVEFASTDPDAKWTLGCQDSCAYGDPYPSSVAKLVSISCLPVSAQVTAKRWIEEAKAICVEKIKNHEEQKENERKEKELEADKEYQKKVAEKWAKK
jgi:hypothetical protein